MPKISEFYGISIFMYFGDHAPPHFHARYGGREAKVDIQHLGVLEGSLPPRALRLVKEWARIHRTELRRAWRQGCAPAPIDPIEPLP
jgi:hypothetical protein